MAAKLGLGLLLILPLGPDLAAQGPPRLTADSLQSLLDQALQAFSAHDFATAAAFFHQLERDFGPESEYQDPGFQRRLLPLQGQAELAANLPTAAARTLGRFVDAHPNDPQHPAALYAFTSALQRDGQTTEAMRRLAQFIELYPTRPEAALAELQRAEILFSLGRTDEAVELLDTFLASDAPSLIRDQARLRAGRQVLADGNLAAAVAVLLDHPWNLQALPEIATLSFAALDLGDQLLAAEEYHQATRAYRLVLPRSRLLHLHRQQIELLRANLQSSSGGEAGRFWRGYYGRLLHNLEGQTTPLEQAEDYTSALLLRRGQALLLVERHHEAWLLFERLALDESLANSIREEAHYRWILAATGLESWEEALAIARNFLARYPEAPLAAQTLHLIAQAHQEQRRYLEATEILIDLRANFPDHPLAQRWAFTLGFNYALLEDFPAARRYFRQAATDYAETQLTANAELWHGLTFFFARDYPGALADFDQLAGQYAQHPLAGEILYRRASTLYAMRDYKRAAQETSDFIERFNYHQRHDEALVLLGDIQMGAGQLEDAVAAFQRIQPEAGPMFLYGLFQQGKILRAQQEYAGMTTLFTDYAERTDLEEKPRLSEALYWVGWAYNQQNEPEKTFPLFLAALQDHGDEPEAAEIGSILQLLERLFPLPDRPDVDFLSWIEQERRTAIAAGRETYFSRLSLHLARIKRRQNFPYQADNLLFEIADLVPMETLGPDALGEVGHMLAESGLQMADLYLTTLLKQFPLAPERAFAFYGLGRRHHQRGHYEEALVWLRRFAHETPTHPLTAEALHLTGQTLLALERFDEADHTFEEILRLRSLRGRPHALALIGLAQSAAAAQNSERAVAYYQRVYTVHRAQTDLTAQAYFESSLLFEQLQEPAAAHRTLVEMLSLTELSSSPYFEKAHARQSVLAPHAAAPNQEQPE